MKNNNSPGNTSIVAARHLASEQASFTRRRFLALSAMDTSALAGAAILGFPAILQAKPRTGAFLHGVASGDPVPDPWDRGFENKCGRLRFRSARSVRAGEV